MTKIKILARHILLISCSLFSLSCNLFTGPSESGTPGRRDYIWTVDTVYSPSNLFSAIYGANPNDVWLGGHGGPPNDRLWHYDGNNWRQVPSPEGENINCIFGFSPTDIWIGGNNGKIFHYDGISWTLNSVYRPPDSDPIITDLYGTNPSDIYALGNLFFFNSDTAGRSAILHRSGSGWKEEYRTGEGVQFVDAIWVDGGKVFLESIDPTLLFYLYSNDRMMNIFSKNPEDVTWGNIVLIGGKVCFLIGNELYRYIQEQFIKVVSFNVDNSNFGFQLFGRNEKDIFLILHDGIEHYNGQDVQYVYRLSTTSPYIFVRALIFEKDAFFVLNYTDPSDFSKHLIVHGKLSN